MDITKEQEQKFKKLGIESFCRLALFVPYAYEDLRIGKRAEASKAQLIDATVESVQRAPNLLRVTFYAHNFGHLVTGIIFRPKPYVVHQFQIGSRDNYYGIVEFSGGQCVIKMPKRVSKAGEIVPKYKCALRSDVMHSLIENSLTKERLIKEGIREEAADEVLKLHFPKETPQDLKNLNKKSLDALKYIELFSYMKALSAKRRYFKSIASTCRDYTEWTKSLPFSLTHEQIKAIEDIKSDLSKSISARRIVVGDVGCGKTAVILASAYMMMPERSILMAPTSILASQLYEEAKRLLPSLRCALVTNKSKKEPLDDYDLIIGTHALLYRDLPKAALIMVDEQHRFGTLQRNMLEKLVSNGEKKPHFLQFSATPIPRTQAMIETAHVDVSLITTAPYKKDIAGAIIRKNDFKALLEHIRSEIRNGNQVLLVYPLVEQSDVLQYQSIEEARLFWESRFDNVYVTHGKDKDKENVLLEFRDKGDILIATTVVEVGISLPRLSSVVVVGAERLGLSTLHQLRGRVSRTGLKGYCFLYTNQKESPRLEEFVRTSSGFDIAELDLMYRRSGDLLKGVNQSGKEFKWIELCEDEEIVKKVKDDLVKNSL